MVPLDRTCQWHHFASGNKPDFLMFGIISYCLHMVVCVIPRLAQLISVCPSSLVAKWGCALRSRGWWNWVCAGRKRNRDSLKGKPLRLWRQSAEPKSIWQQPLPLFISRCPFGAPKDYYVFCGFLLYPSWPAAAQHSQPSYKSVNHWIIKRRICNSR